MGSSKKKIVKNFMASYKKILFFYGYLQNLKQQLVVIVFSGKKRMKNLSKVK